MRLFLDLGLELAGVDAVDENGGIAGAESQMAANARPS
jgi:hypothetical protein